MISTQPPEAGAANRHFSEPSRAGPNWAPVLPMPAGGGGGTCRSRCVVDFVARLLIPHQGKLLVDSSD